MRWFLPVLLGVMISQLHASTITDPGVIITLQDGNATVTWNRTIAGSAIVEHSPDLANWSPLSQNNTAGLFQHAVVDATKGFYRLKWTPSSPQTANMITVQGGMLPSSSQLAGQTVSTFQICKYEVTRDEWQEVRNWAVANGYSDLAGVGEGSAGNHPVRNVSWHDVVQWSNAKSEKEGFTPAYSMNGTVYRTGEFVYDRSGAVTIVTRIPPAVNTAANGYRLPTEAEWEWAARGGVSSQGYTYSGSNDLNAVAWYWDNSVGAVVNIWIYGRGTWPVGQKGANELGLHDMSGNVWEWCWDVVFTSERRTRGGSCVSDADYCTIDTRGSGGADIRTSVQGFRLARNGP